MSTDRRRWAYWYKRHIERGEDWDYEAGEYLLHLFKAIVKKKNLKALDYSPDKYWFDDSGYPMPYTQDVIEDSLRAFLNSHRRKNYKNWEDRQLDGYMWTIMEKAVRRRRWMGPTLPAEPLDEDMAIADPSNPEQTVLMKNIVVKLKDHHLFVLYYRFSIGLTLEETADVLRRHFAEKKIGKSTVANRYKDVRRLLEAVDIKIEESPKDLCGIVVEEFQKRISAGPLWGLGVATEEIFPKKTKVPGRFLERLNALRPSLDRVPRQPRYKPG